MNTEGKIREIRRERERGSYKLKMRKKGMRRIIKGRG